MIKGFKVRIYPTKEQEEMLWNHINGCRALWNKMLELQIDLYNDCGKYLSYSKMSKLITHLRKKYDWLGRLSRKSLEAICNDLNEAYRLFFKHCRNKKNRVGHPRFKSKKKSKQSYPIRYESLYFTNKGKVNIEKIGKVKYKSDLDFLTEKSRKFSNPRITYDNGKWVLSFVTERENQTFKNLKGSVGIDLGIRKLAVIAYNNEQLFIHKFDNINKSKRMRELNKQLKHRQRRLSRKIRLASRDENNDYIPSKNIINEIKKLRKLYAKISNIRHNYTHQCTHKIITLYPERVVMEDLNIRGLLKNKHLSRSIVEMCWFDFIRKMRYKCEYHGIEFIQVDRFFPSSKICSNCIEHNDNLKLEETFICPSCGYTIDRDENAAINLSRIRKV